MGSLNSAIETVLHSSASWLKDIGDYMVLFHILLISLFLHGHSKNSGMHTVPKGTCPPPVKLCFWIEERDSAGTHQDNRKGIQGWTWSPAQWPISMYNSMNANPAHSRFPDTTACICTLPLSRVHRTFVNYDCDLQSGLTLGRLTTQTFLFLTLTG